MAPTSDGNIDVESNISEPRSMQRYRKNALIGMFTAAIFMGSAFLVNKLPVNLFDNAAKTEPTEDRNLQATGRNLQATGNPPKVVWFFTYPESGTTYILHLLHVMSGRSTASNYGTVMMNENGKIYVPETDSVPVYEDRVGPHYNTLLPPPDRYVLTRTHSYGTCFDCPPWKYLGPTAKLRHMKINTYASKITGGIASTNKYKMDDVEKMIVMYRDPLDLAVARFFHRVNKWALLGDTDSVAKYPLDVVGFKKYCHEQDNSNWLSSEKNWYQHGGFWEISSKIPCRSEFVKIFEFYNMAERVHNFHGLAEMRVKLRDFATDLGGTGGNILKFLEQPYVGQPTENKLGAGEGQFYYFYDDEQRKAVAQLGKRMCSQYVWDTGFGPMLTKFL